MDALDLFQLGRWLTRLGEEAMRPLGGSPSRPGRRLVLMDALAFPDSSVGEIATRTGLPQSYVSGMVAKLCDLGILETRADPADRRRTLVKGSGSKPNAVVGFGAVPVDGQLVEAFGDSPPGSAAELVSALGEIAARLRVARGAKATPSARLNGATTVAAVPPGHDAHQATKKRGDPSGASKQQTERSSVVAPSDGPDARHRDHAWRRGLAASTD